MFVVDEVKKKERKRKLRKMRNDTLWHWDIYLLIIIPLALLITYKYVPMYGITIAFKDYSILDGIVGSDWGNPWYKHFLDLFTSRKFFEVFRNTLLINIYRFVFQFPIPIIIALMINDVTHIGFKRITQTISYMPHFLSWVVIGAIFYDILSPNTGIINKLIQSFGGERIMFMADERYFRSVLVVSVAWKESGWGAIIYLSAMTSIDTQLYEAATIDGAGKFKQIRHITLPGIAPTIVFIIMLRLGAMLANDVQQVLMLYNPSVYGVGDVIGTYVYRIGLGKMKYSFATAAGLFSSLIGFILLSTSNYLAKKLGQRGLF